MSQTVDALLVYASRASLVRVQTTPSVLVQALQSVVLSKTIRCQRHPFNISNLDWPKQHKPPSNQPRHQKSMPTILLQIVRKKTIFFSRGKKIQTPLLTLIGFTEPPAQITICKPALVKKNLPRDVPHIRHETREVGIPALGLLFSLSSPWDTCARSFVLIELTLGHLRQDFCSH